MNQPPRQATGKLPPQPWMNAPETVAVFRALEAGGKEARFVGGCVRDAVFGLPVKDIDIATPEPPDRVMELLEAADIRAIPTGIDHGTVTAVVGPSHFEVTTLRVDVESHGRRATVAFTDDWVADALRRDFTINTLSCSRNGDIYDPLTGLDDLGKRWVRFVGLARERIEEDVLRLLRYFRFQATYGGKALDKDALAACRLLAPRLKELAAERVLGELFRILQAPNLADTLLLMNGERVLEHVLPEAKNFGRLRTLAWLETTAIRVESVGPDTIRRFAALLDDDPNGHGELAKRLRFSNRQAERLAAMTRGGEAITPELDRRGRMQALYRLRADGFRDLALLHWAGEKAGVPRPAPDRTDAWLALLDDADTWVQPVFPLKGRDALALGLAPGPDIGKALAAVETWWRDGDFAASREQCLRRLQTVIDGNSL